MKPDTASASKAENNNLSAKNPLPTSIHWQPTLIGSLIRLRPLTEDDFDALFAVGSDPLLWEQHPEPTRYLRENFTRYFRLGIESKGALAIIDQKTGQIIGSSRFTLYDPAKSCVEVGYTFLARSHWGQGHNRELKLLMLNYAFQTVETVFFYVGEENHRSQKAMAGIGAIEVGKVPSQVGSYAAVIYQMKKADWTAIASSIAPHFVQPSLTTNRLTLEPITESHAEELWELFRDPELHHFVPFEPISIEKQRERCARWSKRCSPDGKEVWLNWIAKENTTDEVVGHFQVGIKQDGVASIGYLVGRTHQNKGFSTEALEVIFAYLRDGLGVLEVKAWSDTRNVPSHRLAKKVGMVQVEFIKDADFFKGATSDEYVFSKVLQ